MSISFLSFRSLKLYLIYLQNWFVWMFFFVSALYFVKTQCLTITTFGIGISTVLLSINDLQLTTVVKTEKITSQI